ncbi:MAG: CRISPR-associated protein Csx3 [Bacteroidales bacterium]|nr:CRISPR-associated protein Csx3 [Bacteroidales bacterium]
MFILVELKSAYIKIHETNFLCSEDILSLRNENINGIILYGKIPLWLNASLAILFSEKFNNCFIATYDPRKDGAIVVKGSNNRLCSQVINNIQIPEINELKNENNKKSTQQKQSKTIALIGPPNSGKSVFLFAINEKIKELNLQIYSNDYFLIRACPDGEGNWFYETDKIVNVKLRKKHEFNDDFVVNIVDAITQTKKNKKIILVDCGGKIDKKNQMILNECTDAIIISSKKEAVDEWKGAAKLCNLNIIAIIYSITEYKSQIISDVNGLLELELGYLDRSDKQKVINYIPNELIEHIIN